MKGNKFVNFLAYVSIMLIAVALILGVIFSKFHLNQTLVNSMSLVAQVIAYAITAVYAFYFAKERNQIGYIIAYIIAVILIIIMMVL